MLHGSGEALKMRMDYCASPSQKQRIGTGFSETTGKMSVSAKYPTVKISRLKHSDSGFPARSVAPILPIHPIKFSGMMDSDSTME